MAEEWFPVQLTERSAEFFKKRLNHNRSAIKSVFIRVSITGGEQVIEIVTEASPKEDVVGMSQGFKVVIRKDQVAQLTGLVQDYRSVGAETGLVMKDPRGAHSFASDPGDVSLSHEKLRRLQPELVPSPAGFFGRLLGRNPDRGPQEYRETLDEHLRLGDSRAAVVVSVSPLLVAAYTDELDCIVLLRFPKDFVQDYQLQVGSRLLTVNRYGRDGTKRAPDLTPGSMDTMQFNNFKPLIADFLTDSLTRLAERKKGIDEAEWERAMAMGDAELKRKTRPRDGRPLYSELPSKAMGK